MSKKKKQGSALIVVLVFSLFFIVVSGVSALAVVATFKANNAEEINQTLYYEAEGGISRANVKASMGLYDDLSLTNPTNTESVFYYNAPETNNYVEVSVKYAKEDKIEFLQVTSTSYKGGSVSDPNNSKKPHRTAKARMRGNMGSKDIFKYSICASGVTVLSEGNLKGNTSVINSAEDKASLDGVRGAELPGESNKLFALPEFDETKIRHIPQITFDFPVLANSTFDSKVTNFNNSTKVPGSTVVSIAKMISKRSLPTARADFTVYMFNTDKLNLNFLGSGELNNVLILCSGDIEIYTETGGATKFVTSSIVGKNIKVSKGTIDIVHTPADNTPEGRPGPGNYEGAFSILYDDPDIKDIFNSTADNNRGITFYAPNLVFDAPPVGPGTGVSSNGKYISYGYE